MFVGVMRGDMRTCSRLSRSFIEILLHGSMPTHFRGGTYRQSLNLTEAALIVSGFTSVVVEEGGAIPAELTVVLTTPSKDGRSISTLWKEHQCAAICSFSSLLSFLSSFLLFKDYVLGFVAMTSTHLWPAGSVLATLASPFVPVMGARLVNWARHKQLIGPIVCWLFPVEVGTHPNQRDVEPQVSLNADFIDRMRDVLHDGVQEGSRAAGVGPELTGEVRRQNTLLQQLVDGVERTLEEVRDLRADTYTVTSTITRQVR
jgi:hypothetical protein